MEQLNKNLNIYLEDSIHSMDHSVGSEDVKEDNIGLAGGGLDLDELVPGHTDLLAAGGLEVGGAGGDVLALELGPGHHVPQENGLELLLVCEEGVKSVSRDLENQQMRDSIFILYFYYTLSKAELVGANTVKGPSEDRTSTRSAALTAARSVENLGLVDTSSAMLGSSAALVTTGTTGAVLAATLK